MAQTRSFWRERNHTFRDDQFSPARGRDFWELSPLAALTSPTVAFWFYDDFLTQASTKAAQSGHWTIIEDDGAGTADGVADAKGGIYYQYCDGDQHDEFYIVSNNEHWIVEAGKPIWLEWKVCLEEANTNKAKWLFGLMDAAGADSILDAGGPAATYDGAVWFTNAADLYLDYESSNAGVQTTTADAQVYVSGVFHKLGIFFDTKYTTDTVAKVRFFFDGVEMTTSHNLTIAGLEEMHLIGGVKAGNAGDTNEEHMIVDYVKVVQIR